MKLLPTMVCLGLTMDFAIAHHSYAMFDGERMLKVSGTVAKVEWTNPHVRVWVYVANAAADGGYDLYAFENSSPNVLSSRGWVKTSIAAGDKITVEYWPLKDGRPGGHFSTATYADGRVIHGAGGPRGADGNRSRPAAP